MHACVHAHTSIGSSALTPAAVVPAASKGTSAMLVTHSLLSSSCTNTVVNEDGSTTRKHAAHWPGSPRGAPNCSSRAAASSSNSTPCAHVQGTPMCCELVRCVHMQIGTRFLPLAVLPARLTPAAVRPPAAHAHASQRAERGEWRRSRPLPGSACVLWGVPACGAACSEAA